MQTKLHLRAQARCRAIRRIPMRANNPPASVMALAPCSLHAAAFFHLFTLICLIFSIAGITPAVAQDGVLARGDAVVTGFSGIKPSDAELKPGANPLDEFFIDIDGASARVVSFSAQDGAPAGQLLSLPEKFQLKAGQTGQLFAIALDDGMGAPVPNIYLGATAAYGLQIVVPDNDGDGWPERARTGAPNAEWMTGQFGTDLGGGPGTIYKVDGTSGEVSVFATLAGNSGPGIGDVVFDRASRQFFASDLDNGLIYRLGETGAVIDSFDHGVAGRPEKDLPPVADDGREANIKDAGFDSENPQSWGFTQLERRVHGLAVADGRLYYAVHGQVWSIGISDEGFTGDARWELDAEGLPGEGPVTDMLFDAEGRIYLAQRGQQRASYDYSLFAEPQASSVVRYRRESPDDPDTESQWVAEPEDYAIGMPAEHRHADGGIALNYAHDETGAMRRGACGGMLWSTGHRLRQSALAENGVGEGEADVHGLQGNAVSLVRPDNVPPSQAYFADYDGYFGDAAKAGHMGDVETWQPCEGAPDFAEAAPIIIGELPPGILPPGDFPPELPPEFPPEYEFETNLKLTKRAMPQTCLPWAGGWLCRYRVRITNTGPDHYFGPLLVEDFLPANPAGAVVGFAPQPPWTCWNTGPTAYRCFRPGAFLPPSASVDLMAYAWVPQSYGKCNLRNVAAIEWAPGGSQWNTNPFDDADSANALIPADHCKPGKETDLKIYKRPAHPCSPDGDKLACIYFVTVENMGPGAYNGDIVVEDTIPAGLTASFGGAGWACGGAGPAYTCTYAGANLPNPGTSVSFWVKVELTKAQAQQMNCRVRNEVEILQAPGGSSMNTDPANDTASAEAIVPDQFCKDEPKSNLRISKKASPTFCTPSGSDWWCTYVIRVRNTGPAIYHGPIEVEEALPGEPLDATWNAPWNCVGTGGGGGGAVCTHPNAGGTPTFLTRTLNLRVKFSGDLVKAKNCLLPNVAKIKEPVPGSDENTNPTDDISGDTARVPMVFCAKEPTNLELRKYGAQQQCNIEGGKWRCPYAVVVKNTGPGVYDGEIAVNDFLPPAAAAAATFEVLPPWNCVGAAPSITCTHPMTQIDPGQQVLMQVFAFIDPAKYNQCSLTNTARIVKAAGGTVQNQNAGDDQASATLDFPALLTAGQSYCVTPVPSQTCPPGFTWNGSSCDRIVTPPAVIPPVRECPPGTTGRFPNCRETGDDTPNCTGGRILRGGACVCPGRTRWNGEQCVTRNCPSGTRGVYPDCRKVVADPPRQCSGGRIRRGEACVCPRRTRWNGEECVKRACPPGMRGVYPNCRKVVVDPPRKCPTGTVGRWPNCRKIERNCPPGMVGKPPRCRPIVRTCPPGMVGRPPRCKRIEMRPNLRLQRPERGSNKPERGSNRAIIR